MLRAQKRVGGAACSKKGSVHMPAHIGVGIFLGATKVFLLGLRGYIEKAMQTLSELAGYQHQFGLPSEYTAQKRPHMLSCGERIHTRS